MRDEVVAYAIDDLVVCLRCASLKIISKMLRLNVSQLLKMRELHVEIGQTLLRGCAWNGIRHGRYNLRSSCGIELDCKRNTDSTNV